MSKVEIVEIKDQIVIGLRNTGEYSKLIPEQLGRLYMYTQENRIEIVGAPTFVCHEKTHEDACEAIKNKNADVESCVPIAKMVEVKGDFKCYELKGGKFAKITHKGPYDKCEPAYCKLFEWVKKNKKEINGCIREVYLNDPREVKPNEVLTNILYPIK